MVYRSVYLFIYLICYKEVSETVKQTAWGYQSLLRWILLPQECCSWILFSACLKFIKMCRWDQNEGDYKTHGGDGKQYFHSRIWWVERSGEGITYLSLLQGRPKQDSGGFTQPSCFSSLPKITLTWANSNDTVFILSF